MESIELSTARVPTGATKRLARGNDDGILEIIAKAGEAFVGSVGGILLSSSTEFTRPSDTTAYTIGDVVSNSTSSTIPIALANAFRTSTGTGYITGIRLSTDKKSITPRFRVHFFGTNDATLSVDNAAHKDLYAENAKRLGFYDMPAMWTPADATNSTVSRSFDFTMRIPVIANASTTLYAVLETLDAFTPVSGQKFTLTVSVDNN